MVSGRGAQCFVSDEDKIVARRELAEPIVHRTDNGAHAKIFVPQHFAHGLLPELGRRVWIASCQLQVKRNKTITRISSQQDNLRPFKLASGYEIFAAKPVPTIAFCPVLEEVMREHNARKTGYIVASRAQRELKAEA